MHPDPLTIGPKATLAEAGCLLEAHRIRQDPSHVDPLLQLLRVEHVMTADPVSISADAPIAEAARLLLDRRFGGLPVVH